MKRVGIPLLGINCKDFFKGCVMTSGDIHNAAFEESKIRNLRYYMIYIERKECIQR